MITLPSQFLPVTIRIVVVVACLFDIWNSWKVARADYLFRQDTVESIRSAISLTPDASEYYVRLAQFDDGHGRELLETALRLNQYNAQASIDLGLRYEATGDYFRAEKLLLQAFAVDHTYVARWSLVNFYLRRDNMPAFWTWARRAAEMPAEDIGALFDLCWRVSPDPQKIAATMLNNNPELLRQYLNFLLGKNQPLAAAETAPRLIRTGTPEADRLLLFSVVNRLVSADDATAANTLWHELIQQRWVVADTTVPNNAAFARDPQPVSFDWTLSSFAGLNSWPGPSGLETEFTGSEPENSSIAEQTVALAPGNYMMKWSYRTTDIPPGTGIQWQIVDAKSDAVLATSPSLSNPTPTSASLPFSVPPDASLLRLRLMYQRALGTPRISGTLMVRSVQIENGPKS